MYTDPAIVIAIMYAQTLHGGEVVSAKTIFAPPVGHNYLQGRFMKIIVIPL